MSYLNRFLFFVVFSLFYFLPFQALAQELYTDVSGTWKAEVVRIISEEERLIPGTATRTKIQHIEARILEGERSGELVYLENDLFDLKTDQTFFMSYLFTDSGVELFSVRDIDRQNGIIFLVIFFIAVVVIFSGMQGVRSILSLIASFVVIIYVLLPLLMKGYDPIVISVIVGSAILFFAIYFTHGFSKLSSIAFFGTVLAVCITGFLASVSIDLLNLSGFFSDETVYLNFNTGGALDFRGLLLGAIIIGVLGVLDDIAVTQVAVVSELKSVGDKISKKDLYLKALRVGRDHTSALVNTLVLAYTAVALPLLLLLSQADTSIMKILNSEIFATEIVRTIVGSIGLILTVPITTFLAVAFLKPGEGANVHHHHTHTH